MTLEVGPPRGRSPGDPRNGLGTATAQTHAMRRTNTSRLAWMVFGVVALLYAAGLGLSLLIAAGRRDGGIDAIVLVMLAFPVVGARSPI